MPTIRVKSINKNIFISAYEKGQIIGSVTFRFVKKGHYLVDMLQVNDKYQDKGIGSLMMREGMKRAKIVTLSCFPEVLEFYQKLGFKILREKIFGGVYRRRKGYEMIWKA